MTELQDVLDYIETHKEGNWEAELRPVHLAMQKADKERKDKKRKAVKAVCIEAQEVALYLADEISARYTFQKLEPQKWAVEIEKINRIDKFDWDTIKTVARFSQQDDFWKMQVRSGKNLRKHFEKLIIQTQAYYKRKLEDRVVEV